jgi:hypothetical protein
VELSHTLQQGDVMRKQIPKLLTMLATAACIFGFVLMAPADTPTLSPMPTAGAQPMGNGYDATCTKANDNQVTCNISGCPRVHEDLAGDSLNYKVNGGEQQNIPKSCGNTSTVTVNSSGAFTLSFQGCRGTGLFDTNSGSCGAWADYQYTPPVQAPVNCPAGSKTPSVVPPAQCEAAPKVACPQGSPTPDAVSLDQCAPVPAKTCPPGSAADTVPAGQQCQGPTNAVSMDITQEGLNANVAVTNNSALPAECAYTATKTGGLVGPATVNRSVSVPANGTGNITDMLWPPPLVSYRATVKCTATFDGKQVSIGESTKNVSG